MMISNFEITRSDEFILAARLATGSNEPECIRVMIAIESLSPESRKLLLDYGSGAYLSVYNGIGYDDDFEVNRYSGYGKIPFAVDADLPTAHQVDLAIRSAFASCDEKRAVHLEKMRAKEAADRALAAEWASIPLARRASKDGPCYCWAVEYARDILQKYVPAAWKEAQERAGLLRKIADGEEAANNLDTLANFLRNVPADALRGTLKRVAGGPAAVRKLREEIESASPYVIFEEDTDGDDDGATED